MVSSATRGKPANDNLLEAGYSEDPGQTKETDRLHSRHTHGSPFPERGSVKYLKVKNWSEFQHYSDRNPPWIKLYNTLLDNHEFYRLQDDSKLLLICIWMLASRNNNRIPYDIEWLSRALPLHTIPDLDPLIQGGWLDVTDVDGNVLSIRKQTAIPETYNEETETYSKEGEKEEERDTGGEKHPPVPTQKLIDLYHKTCSTLPKVVSVPLSKMSQASLRQRWREHPDLDWWGGYFSRIDHSAFLKGDNDKGWIADFQWIIKPSNMEKIVNGRYDRSRGKGRHAAPADRSDYAGL